MYFYSYYYQPFYTLAGTIPKTQICLTFILSIQKYGLTLNSTLEDSITARRNTEGINKALQDAKANGYKTIKFPSGKYIIQSEWGRDRWGIPNPANNPALMLGVVVPSDITLDLTNTTFQLLPNNRYSYSLFLLNKVKNVKIVGGHLIGDRDMHTYTSYPGMGSDSHEWGFGINVSASENVLIEGVKVEKMTGDAVILNGYDKNEQANKNIKVTKCDLSNCRRQGISVICGYDCELSYNKIYNIKGTLPEYGIDIEAEVNYGLYCERVEVHHNNIYDVNGGAISCHTGNYINVYENTVKGWVSVIFSKHVKIYNNTLIGCNFYLYDGATPEMYNNTIK